MMSSIVQIDMRPLSSAVTSAAAHQACKIYLFRSLVACPDLAQALHNVHHLVQGLNSKFHGFIAGQALSAAWSAAFIFLRRSSCCCCAFILRRRFLAARSATLGVLCYSSVELSMCSSCGVSIAG